MKKISLDYFGDQEFNRSNWVNSNAERVDLKKINKDDIQLPMLRPIEMNENFKSGLEQCFWPGRNQIIKSADNVTYYLDGAHTVESIDQFIKWFKEEDCDRDARNVLLFNYTGYRLV